MPRNESIAINIEAKDKASAVIDKLAKKIDGMEADEARITVAADTRKLQDQLDRATLKLAMLTGDEATVQARLVGTLEEDLEQANKLLDQLEGQTATVKIDSTAAKQGLDEVGKSADSSKSVLANMVGNTTQDLGALGGVAGSAGVAIGQMGEYMVDAANDGDKLGDVLKNFSAVAGPILLLTAAVQAVTGAVAAQKARTEEAKRVTGEFGEAMADAADDSVGFADMLRDNQEAMSEFWTTSLLGEGFAADVANIVNDAGRNIPILGRLFQDLSVDVPDALNDVGISVHQFGRALNGTKADQQAFVQLLEDNFAAGLLTSEQLAATTQIFNQYASAVQTARESQKLYNVDAAEANALLAELIAKNDPLSQMTGTWRTLFADMADGSIDTKEAATAVNELAAALGLTQEEVIALAVEQDKGRESHQRSKAAIDDNRAALDRHRDALNTARDATDRLREANEKLRGDLDKREAILNLKDTFEQLGIEGTNAIGAVQSGYLDAEHATRQFELQQIAAKQEVLNYIDAIGDIPPEKESHILALIDQGKYDEAVRAIELLTEDQEVTVRFRVIRPPSLGVGSAGGGGVPTAATTTTTTTLAGFAAPATTGTEVVLPVRLKLPTATQIARQIGPLNLAIAASLTAHQRLAGVRD